MRVFFVRLLSIVLIALSLLALEDITTGSEPDNVAEYVVLCVTAGWFLFPGGSWLARR